MAQSHQILGQSLIAANTSTLVYAVPVAAQAILSMAVLHNTSGVNTTEVLLKVAPGGVADTSAHRLYKVPLVPGESVEIGRGITLAATDELRVHCDNAGVAVTIFGVELT